jgi:hypothetical protein
MKIDLQSAIEDAEELLAGLRELNGTEIDEEGRGRVARHQRSNISICIQRLGHQTDRIRVSLYDIYFAYRDVYFGDREEEKDSGRGRGAEAPQAGHGQPPGRVTLPVRDGED